MMIRIFYLGVLLTCHGLGLWAQSYKKPLDQEAYRHHLSYSDHQVSFFTLPLDAKMGRAKLDREYHWFAGRQLNMTMGGYSGKPLHGRFTSFYLNKQLKEQGDFNKGLKVGEWKQWSENGSLLSRTSYRYGVASGSFYKYDDKGILIEKGNYSSGKLSGKLKKFAGPDSVVVQRYHNGVAYQKSGISWWKFWKKRKQP